MTNRQGKRRDMGRGSELADRAFWWVIFLSILFVATAPAWMRQGWNRVAIVALVVMLYGALWWSLPADDEEAADD